LDSSNRRYLIGNVTIKDLTGFRYSLPVGKETDFTGLCKDVANGVNSSTLVGALSPTVVVRAKVQPFVSDLGYFDFNPNPNNSFFDQSSVITTTSRVGLESHNCLFSLPKGLSEYGVLDSCHYDFYKYRTSWIFVTSNKEDYSDLVKYCGKRILRSDGSYPSNDEKLNPSVGYAFPCYFDCDDLPSVSNASMQRYFNDNLDGEYDGTQPIWAYRIDCPGWVFYDPHLVGSSISDNQGDGKDNILDGNTLESYFDGYQYHFSNALPRRLGACSSDLVYVPSYSKNERFCKYGYVDETVSKADLFGSAFSSLKNQLDYSIKYTVGFDNNESEGFSIFKELWSSNNSSKVEYVFGDNQSSLLSSYSDSDFMVSNAFPSYKNSLGSFVASNSGNDVYRLTFNVNKTSSNVCVAGKSNFLSAFWTAKNATASKTDVCLDFEFIDFTFRDDKGKSYTLPASNDPFSTFGDVHQAYIPYLPTLLDLVEDSLSSWFKSNPWIWAVVAVVLLAVVIILAKVFPPIFKALKGVFKFLVVLAYFFLIWWWYALLCVISKKPVPKLWFWKS
jgi:hypothetical protein